MPYGLESLDTAVYKEDDKKSLDEVAAILSR